MGEGFRLAPALQCQSQEDHLGDGLHGKTDLGVPQAERFSAQIQDADAKGPGICLCQLGDIVRNAAQSGCPAADLIALRQSQPKLLSPGLLRFLHKTSSFQIPAPVCDVTLKRLISYWFERSFTCMISQKCRKINLWFQIPRPFSADKPPAARKPGFCPVLAHTNHHAPCFGECQGRGRGRYLAYWPGASRASTWSRFSYRTQPPTCSPLRIPWLWSFWNRGEAMASRREVSFTLTSE